MSEIEELISSVSYVAFEEFGENKVVSIEDVSDIMKIYAEHYTQKVISEIKKPENKLYHSEIGMCSYIIYNNFKLPEHD